MIKKWMLLASVAVSLVLGVGIGLLASNIWLPQKEAASSKVASGEEAVLADAAVLMAGTGTQELVNREDIQVRINDGMIQWFDGKKWNEVSSVEEMQQKDKFYLAKSALEEFEQQYMEERAAQQNESIDENELKVGVKKKESNKTNTATQTTTTKPGSTQTTVTKPGSTQIPAAPQTPSTDAGGGSSGADNGGDDNSSGESGGNSSGDSGDNSSGDSSGETPETPPTQEPVDPPVEEPADPPVDDSTGDGENMDWSDDYL